MIYMWSKKDINQELEFVRNGENIYIDERGSISNHELTEPVNLIGLISSKEPLELIIIIPNKNKNICLLKAK